MNTIEQLERLFTGRDEDLAIGQIEDVLRIVDEGPWRLVCVAEDADVTIDFVKRDGQWYVSGYSRGAR